MRVPKVGAKTEYPVVPELTRSCEPEFLDHAPLTVTTGTSKVSRLELGPVYVLCLSLVSANSMLVSTCYLNIVQRVRFNTFGLNNKDGNEPVPRP